MSNIMRVIAFFLGTGVLTVFIGMQITPQAGAAQEAVTARFDDATGARIGDPVRIAGVQVGQVSGLEVENGRAVLTMLVDREHLPLPEDTQAAITWLNLIGMRQVDLSPGTSTTMLPDNHVLHTKSVVDMAALADELDPFARELRPEAINALLQTVFESLDGNEDDITVIVDNLDTILATLADRDEVVTRMIDDYAAVGSAIASRNTQIRVMIDNLVTLTETFAGSEQILFDALEDTSMLAADMRTFLDLNANELSAFLADFADLTQFAGNNISHIEALIELFPPGLAAMFGATSFGPFLSGTAECITADTPPSCPAMGSLTTAATLGRLLLGDLDEWGRP